MTRWVRRILPLVLAILLCFAGTACNRQEFSQKNPLKIISFNVQNPNNGDSFLLRTEMMTEFIAKTQPDCIGMQEAPEKWCKAFNSECFGEQYSGVGGGQKTLGEMNPIYYRNDKFDLVDSNTFWLSATPDVSGSKFEESNEPRTATWARLKSKSGKREFVCINVHLDHMSSQARLKQGRVLLEFISTLGDVPILLTGDFNQPHLEKDGSYRLLYQYITGKASFTAANGNSVSTSFSDARLEAPETVSPSAWATLRKHHQTNGNPATNPIDFIFYTSQFTPQVYQNINPNRDGVFFISDHLAQYCEFTF